MKYYGIYTQRHIVDGTFTDDSSLNGWYDLSFFQDYPNYALPVEIQDGDNLVPKEFLHSEFRPFIVTSEFSLEEIIKMSSYIPKEFNIQLLDADSFYEWIKSNTSLEEVSPRKFLVSPEVEWISGEVIPAKYIVIE